MQVAGGQAWVSPFFRSHAFWLVSYTFVVVMLGSTLPSPLYVIYQGRPLVCKSPKIPTLPSAHEHGGVLALYRTMDHYLLQLVLLEEHVKLAHDLPPFT